MNACLQCPWLLLATLLFIFAFLAPGGSWRSSHNWYILRMNPFALLILAFTLQECMAATLWNLPEKSKDGEAEDIRGGKGRLYNIVCVT